MSSMDALARSVRAKIGINESVEDEELMHHVERACTEIYDLLVSSYGPRGMNKMIINPVNDVFLTSDGKTIMEEIDILHPVVTSLKDIAKSMDRACGDGTKTAVILAAGLIRNASMLIKRGVHPSTIIKGYRLALNKTYELLEHESFPAKSYEQMYAAVLSSTAGKGIDFIMADKLARNMMGIVENLDNMSEGGFLDLDENVSIIKKVGKPDIVSISGVILDERPARKDMPDTLDNPEILILKGDVSFKSAFLNSQHNIRMDSYETSVMFEKEQKRIVNDFTRKIVSSGAEAVFCEGDVDPLIESTLSRNRILLFKKLQPKDLLRLSKSTGATMMSIHDDDLCEGTGRAERVEVSKKCNEYFVFVRSHNRMISTILIWEPVRYGLEKIEEAADDALTNAAFILRNRMIVTGGGGIEFILSQMLRSYATTIEGKEQLAVEEYASALEDIPRILAKNAGMDVFDSMAQMSGYYNRGIDARIDTSGRVCENNPPIYDCASIKKLAIISATEAASNVLRIDRILAKS
ncbi:chaperonin Cpn60/TCP-1 [Methanosalsum zhilinae DSM 4017]|uniref:Chaperonin Cpn60/TCP-1 n=2 Tax=Methanosalsum zhilinae TaxID=39669 RepID=F7XQN3_METZD|nr:chaperonin Cpn60/TCP-1 [Methanosalsum zhilinae DSM 4017]